MSRREVDVIADVIHFEPGKNYFWLASGPILDDLHACSLMTHN